MLRASCKESYKDEVDADGSKDTLIDKKIASKKHLSFSSNLWFHSILKHFASILNAFQKTSKLSDISMISKNAKMRLASFAPLTLLALWPT